MDSRIDIDIKNGSFKRIYLLYGNQSYLRNIYKDRLVKALIPDDNTLNYSYYEGKNVPIGEVIDLAETLPFMSDRRVIVLENTGLFAEACPQLEEYISSIPETTCMIFSEEKADGRLKQFKSVKSAGMAVEYKDLSEDELKKWITGRLNREHRGITGNALNLFIENCGTDMMMISKELDKLVAYTYGKDGIYPEDVQAICSPQTENQIFLMLDEIFKHNTDGALSYYGDLLALHEQPIRIMALIQTQLRLLYHIKVMASEGHSAKSIAEGLEMNEYRVKKALPQAQKSSKIWLRKALSLCANTDEAFKSGRVDAQIGLEMVICELARAEK